MGETVSTVHLEPGARVLTSEPVGSDFGLPLVQPEDRKRQPKVAREVRSRHRCQGGTVVWFTDGTKSIPLNGRTTWRRA